MEKKDNEKTVKEEKKEQKPVAKKVVKEEEDDEFFDKKGKKNKNEKSMFSKVMNIVLWIVLFAWIAICLIDFYKVHQEKEPMFCINKKTTTYSDGTVDTCTGPGYKVFNYKRKSFTAIEFGPIWSKDRTADNK